MKRATVVLFALVLVIAACGDDDDQPAATSQGAATTAAPAATTVAPVATTAAPAATTTMAPVTTTTAAPEPTTTTEAPSGPRAFIAAAADYVGEYEGTWDNTTFGSSGSLYLNIVEADTTAGFVLIQVDLGGNVFGGVDPDQFVMEISTAGDELYIGSTPLFGEPTVEIGDDGTFTLTGVAGGLDLPIVVEGTVVEDGLEGTYSIEGLAEGTWNAAFIG